MKHYFAVVDDRDDVRNPVTVVRVVEGGGITRLNDDAAWERTALLDQIESGAVPYRLRPIAAAAAIRIRRDREKSIAFRYSLLVEDDDPAGTPFGVMREWDATGDGRQYVETYSGDGEDGWQHSNMRANVERGGDITTRIVPSDAATVNQFIESLTRR